MTLDNEATQQLVQFIKTATETVESLEARAVTAQLKEAAARENADKYHQALDKVAEVLTDNDFLSTKQERQEFFKRAKEDPSYLVRVIERVCKAAEVSLIGKPARVASRTGEEFDPVMARAFGYDSQNTIIDE